ncbi:MAG: hypothetical protein U0441_32690 [Polyangiaceae bacterium]
MSGIDVRSADPANSADDPCLALTMEQHAGIAVALAEGFSRADVLAQEQIDEGAYRPADVAWKKRLVDDAAGEGKLFAAYQARRAEAEDWLRRKVEPLDSDLGAWLGFLKAWGSTPRPFEILARNGLTLNDVGRLGRVWERAFEKDDKLKKRAEKLAPEAQMPAKVSAAPRELRPFPWSPGAVLSPPPAPAPPAEIDAPPPPELPAEIVVQAVTPSYLRDGARADPPSTGRDAGADAARLKLPSYARNIAPDTTSPIFYLRGTDGLPFSPESGPSKLSISAPEPGKPAQSGETALSVDISKMAITPFEKAPSKGGAPDVPAAQAKASAPPVIGETVTLDPGLVAKAKASLPFQKKDTPESKVPVVPAAQSKPPASAPIGETVTLDPGLVAKAQASMPFGRDKAPPAAAPPVSAAAPPAPAAPPARPAGTAESPPALSLLDHAALWAEIALKRTPESEILTRAGLDAASKAALDAYFQRLRTERPPADAAWTKAYRDAYARLLISSWKGPTGG